MRYELKVLKTGEGISLIELDAGSEEDASIHVKHQGYSVLGIREIGTVFNRITSRRTNFPLLLFSQELLSLITAGLSLIEALEALAEKERNSQIKQVYDTIVRRLYEGQTFSTALSEQPSIFPPLYIATVQASERTGDMHEALSRFVAYQTQLDMIKKRIVSASIYPALLLIVGALVVTFLMGYVVPRFSAVYEGSNTTLPFMSQMLLNWGVLLKTHGQSILMTFIAVIAFASYMLSQAEFRAKLVLQLWHLPSLGERLHVYQLARFYRTLSMLLKGGTPVVNALDMVAGLLQPTLRSRLELATTSIREGKPISVAMEHYGLTTPVALRMLRVGERTGDMSGMMDRIATFYDEEMSRWVEWFTKLFEPILMALIGLIIGAIVVLMYMPVFDLAGNIQ